MDKVRFAVEQMATKPQTWTY